MKKYYPKKTKSKLFILSLFTIVFLTVYSCHKAETASAVNNPAAYTIDLNVLKASYTSDTLAGKTQNFATANNPPTKIITSLNVSWALVHYLKRATSRVFEFDMQHDAKSITPVQPVAGQNIRYYSKTSLVFINFNDSTKRRFFMKVTETVSDSGTSVLNNVHYNHIPVNFTGRILYYTTAKKLINGYNYVNGKITNGYMPSSASVSGGKTIQSTDKQTLSEYFCIDWYWGNNQDGWEYLGTDCYLVTQESGGDAGGDGGGGCPVASSPTQGNPTPTDPNPGYVDHEPLNVIGGKLTVMDTGNCDPQAVVQDIKDSLVNQCLIQALNQILLNQNINTTISTLINKIFNTNDKVNITYKESSSFVSTKLGNTVNDGYSLNSAGDTVLNITVSLNSNVLPGASQELIAVTILHEALHGYLDYTRIQGITGDPLAEHYYMSTKYIDLLRNAIQTTFHLNSGAVNALILSEMGDLAKSAPLTFDSIVVSHGLTHNGILDSLTLYENGTKGTPCH